MKISRGAMATEAFFDTVEYLIKNRALLVFDVDTKTLKAVEMICLNGNTFQLTTEKWEDEDEDKS